MSEANNKFGKLLFYLLICSLSFTNLLNNSLVGTKIQVTELVFLAVMFYLLFNWKKLQISFLWNKSLLLSAGLLALAVAISSITANAWLEIVGFTYLIALAIATTLLLSILKITRQTIVNAFILLGVITAILGILGWCWYQFTDIYTPLVRSAETYYPYFGFIGRAQGFHLTPMMYIAVLTIPIFFGVYALTQQRFTNTHTLICAVLLIGAVLSLSKSILLIFLGLVYYFYRLYFPSKKLLVFGIIIPLFLILQVGTNFFVLNKDTLDHKPELFEYFNPQSTLFTIHDKAVFPTIYGHLKSTAFAMGIDHPLIGVGQNQFYHALYTYQESGIYPANFDLADPHCTYIGAFAELGLLGVMALLYFIFSVYRTKDLGVDDFQLIFKILFAIILIEGINADVLHFRHYWVLLGVWCWMLKTSSHTPNAMTRQINA